MTAVERALRGAVDLHCHSGPSPFPRRVDHAEAARDGDRIGMRAILVKSHHHSTVMDLLAMGGRAFRGTRTRAFGGVVLNAQVGGVNPRAVELALRMGGRAVWFPTLSAPQHLRSRAEHAGKFPEAGVRLADQAVPVLDDRGELLPEAREVLALAAEAGALVACGHVDVDSIAALLGAAREAGVRHLVVNHPEFVVGASHEQALAFASGGAFIEHSLCMYDDRVPNRSWDVEVLYEWVSRVGPERTVLASDLGQVGNPLPVDSFLHVGEQLLGLGCSEEDLRLMACDNPARLLGLEPDRAGAGRGRATPAPALRPGLSHTVERRVEGRLLTSFWEGAPDVEVLATPALAWLFELAAAEATDPLLPAGRVTVGSSLSVEHLRAAPAGSVVEVRAVVTEVAGRSVGYDLVATSAATEVARGRHTRVVVDRERFAARAGGDHG